MTLSVTRNNMPLTASATPTVPESRRAKDFGQDCALATFYAVQVTRCLAQVPRWCPLIQVHDAINLWELQGYLKSTDAGMRSPRFDSPETFHV